MSLSFQALSCNQLARFQLSEMRYGIVPFLKCLSSDLLHATHEGCNIVVKIKVAHSVLNSLLMPVFVW
jgi:hypothetical protein